VADVIVRPMTTADVEASVEVQHAAFSALDVQLGKEATQLSELTRTRATARHQHFIDHDPGGSWVATVDERIVGATLALRRDNLWGLSLLAVDPDAQSSGIGRQLLTTALGYADGCDRAIIESSADPRAIRAYATSGFALFPQVVAHGPPDLTDRPTHRTVREGTVADLDFADEVDRLVRGAAHGPDHALIAQWGLMFVVDDSVGRGYAHVRDGDVYLLAATDDDTASALLWRCFEHFHESDKTAVVSHLNAEQQWALDACFTARLVVKPDGPVFWRGATPPRAYLASGAFL
jgi:GNAT superfamily N-acetyltransferase